MDQFLRNHPSVKIVLVQWVDICGLVRGRMVPVQSFVNLIESGGYLNSSPLDLVVPITEDLLPEVFDHFTGRGKIYPDVSTLRVARHDSANIGNMAMVMAVVDFLGLDARKNLKRVISRAEEENNMKFLFGSEMEVCFMKPDSLEAAVPRHTGIGNTSYTQRSDLWPMVNEIMVALAEADLHIEQVIKEVGTSQWEIALPPLPPLQSVDAYVYAREVVKNIAHKYGVVATFSPTPFSGDSGQMTGIHIHMSATRVRDSPDWDPDTVMAGILSHIPHLMPIGLPQIDSYPRVGAARMGTGGLLGWGDNNRDMPVRRISADHWEIRTHDGTANPYAMVAGLIAAATDRQPLTIGNATSK